MPLQRLCVIVFALMVFISRLSSQDISIGSKFLSPAAVELQTMPVLETNPEVPVPAAVLHEQTPLIEIWQEKLSASGGAPLKSQSLNNSLKLRDQPFPPLRFSPARKNKKAVESNFWLTFIYNPASANKTGEAATPRILDAAPCLLSTPVYEELQRAGLATKVIWITSELNTQGEIELFQIEGPHTGVLRPHLERTLSAHWRFAPARRGGVAQAAQFRFPMVVLHDASIKGSKALVSDSPLPFFIEHYEPREKRLNVDMPLNVTVAVPLNLTRGIIEHSGRSSEERRFEATIGKDGLVKKIVVLGRDGKKLNDHLNGVFTEWRFSPPTRGGKPVQVVATFALRQRESSATYDDLQSQNSPAGILFNRETPYPEGLIRLRSTSHAPAGIGMPTVATPIMPNQNMGSATSLAGGRSTNPFRGGIPADTTRIVRSAVMKAHATVAFTVDETGSVIEPKLVSTNGAAFGPAAMSTFLSRRYIPARVNGNPVRTTLKESLVWGPQESSPTGAPTLFSLIDHAKITYDEPLQLRYFAPVIYPRDAKLAKKNGSASATLVVDEAGHVVDVTIEQASEPDFGHALRAALESCRFKPFCIGGVPKRVTLRHQEIFRGYFFGASNLPEENALVIHPEEPIEDIAPIEKIDQPPRALIPLIATFPLSQRGKNIIGQTKLELTLASDGHVNDVRIIETSDPAFGFAAVQAAAATFYEAPRKDGIPVATRILVDVTFDESRARPTPRG